MSTQVTIPEPGTRSRAPVDDGGTYVPGPPRRRGVSGLAVALVVAAALGGFALGSALPDPAPPVPAATPSPGPAVGVPLTTTRPVSADAAERWYQSCMQGAPERADPRESWAQRCW